MNADFAFNNLMFVVPCSMCQSFKSKTACAFCSAVRCFGYRDASLTVPSLHFKTSILVGI